MSSDLKKDPFLLVLAGVIVIGLGLAILLSRGEEPEAPPRPVPDTYEPPEKRVRRPTPPPRSSDLSMLGRAGDPTPIATDLRNRALVDPDFRKNLVARLSADRDPETRSRLALILGSIPRKDAQEALVAALLRGGDPEWMETLILALGQDKDRDEPFNQAEGAPWVVGHPSGLLVYNRTVFIEEHIVDALADQLDHKSKRVRLAAQNALMHTLWYHGDTRELAPDSVPAVIRKGFLDRIPKDADEDVRAALGHSLAEWTARMPSSVPQQRETVDGLLEAADKSDDVGLRFRTASGLGRTAMSTEQRGRLIGSIKGKDFDRRAWAMGVLAAQAKRVSKEERRSIRGTYAEALQDPDAKIREIAARSLGSVPGGDELLVEAIRDPEWHVRAAAARALGYFSRSDAARAALEEATSDPNETVRKIAAEALKPR